MGRSSASATRNCWVDSPRIPPKKPTSGTISPVIGPGCALYQIENDFYAFSAKTGKWGVLHLEDDKKPTSAVSPTDISVFQDDRLYIFPLKSGVWSRGIAGRMVAPREGPARAGMN